MTTTLLRRVEALEATAYRTGQQFDQVGADLAHLTDAVGDLSQQQRELRLSMTELRTRVDALTASVAQMRREHGDMLRTILERLPG